MHHNPNIYFMKDLTLLLLWIKMPEEKLKYIKLGFTACCAD